MVRYLRQGGRQRRDMSSQRKKNSRALQNTHKTTVAQLFDRKPLINTLINAVRQPDGRPVWIDYSLDYAGQKALKEFRFQLFNTLRRRDSLLRIQFATILQEIVAFVEQSNRDGFHVFDDKNLHVGMTVIKLIHTFCEKMISLFYLPNKFEYCSVFPSVDYKYTEIADRTEIGNIVLDLLQMSVACKPRPV